MFGTSLSPPTTSSTSRKKTSCRLRCKPRGLCRRLAGSPGPGCGDAVAAPGGYLPFRNIIPGKFRLREGEGDVGRGGDENRGRRFQPGSSSHTQLLPLTARGGGWIEGCSVYPEGCMSRGNGPPRSQIFKNPQATQPARPPPPGRSRAARRSAIGRRQEPRSSHPRGLGSRGGRHSGSGRRPAPGGAQRGGGGAGSATRRGPTSRAPAPAGRAPRVPALGCRSLAARPPALPLGLFSLRRCASESPSL